MDRLARTRSQHFMHSPRRVASPLKLRHGQTTRHPNKRRRLGSAAQTLPHSTNIFSSNSNSDTEDTSPEGSRRRQADPLSADIGQQTANRNITRPTLGRYGEGKKDVKGKGKVVVVPTSAPTFSSDGSSPRKRKRDHGGNVASTVSTASTASVSSDWAEMDEDEQEPEFIAESDQHLIDDAPAYALHRLRKAEMIRLWKVAGMWQGEDDDFGSSNDEDDQGMSKKDLVDGLIAARKHSSAEPGNISSGRKAVIDFSNTGKHSTSTSTASLLPLTPVSSNSSSEDGKDMDATPRAVPRTRSKARVKINGETTRGTRRAVKGVRERLLKARSKSLGGQADKEDRKARFGDDVKSPAHGLLNRKARRASSIASSYTTTDDSPPTTPVNSRQPSRRSRKSGVTPARRLSRSASSKKLPTPGTEEVEDISDSESDEAEPTPLVKRLRPRTKSAASEHISEADADGEETEDEQEARGADIPSTGPSSRLRSKDRTDHDESMVQGATGLRRTRSAKIKAKKALRAQGAESDTDVDMDVDEPITNGDLTDEPQPVSMIKTRSQNGQLTRRHTRRNSRLIQRSSTSEAAPQSSKSNSLTPPPPSSKGMDIVDEDTENDTKVARTTRSGKLFGVWQSRSRRRKLRQEAMDDPDMNVDDEDEQIEEDEEEVQSDDEEEESFEADLDLSDATIPSLTRLLRDELVEMCEARGIEVGGTKPVLAKALLEWRDEQISTHSTSSQSTARPSSGDSVRDKIRTAKPKPRAQPKTGKIIHAIGSNQHVSGKTTPVLLRDHVHAHDPATPPHSDDAEGNGDGEESKRTNGENELNFDLQELGLEDTVIKPQLLQKLERIGSGGFKDVYVGKYRGRKVAISEFREHLSEMDIRELKLLSEFSHPNIVKFRGICIPEDNSQIQCMLVSELCENGDLFDYIRNVDCPSLKRLLGLMLDIAKGLEYLHTHTPPIIHRDCKSSNILINRAGHAKVGDFGLARVKNSTRSMIRSLVGTVNWQAPELWSPKPQYDYKVDVFSAGMVFWEMMSGWTGEKKYPWEGHNEHYIYDAVGAKHKRPSTAGLRKHWGTEPVNLLERMWHQDPRERPTMTDVVTDLEVLYAAA